MMVDEAHRLKNDESALYKVRPGLRWVCVGWACCLLLRRVVGGGFGDRQGWGDWALWIQVMPSCRRRVLGLMTPQCCRACPYPHAPWPPLSRS
jgi:hypothetical protein